MSKKDYYEVLGLTRGATAQEIKKAYRDCAKKFHPDLNPGDKAAEEKFKEASEAYDVLSDEKKRAQYDQYGHNAFAGGSGFGGGSGSASGFADMFQDIFGDVFGGGGRRSGPAPGADLQYRVEIDLEDAVKGKTMEIKIPSVSQCTVCSGSGAKPGSKKSTCVDCDGQGQVRIQQGFFVVQQTCPSCQGSGERIESPCSTCRGQGRVRDTKTLSVKIPAGVDTGDRIRLAGEGEAGEKGGRPGDLYIQTQVRPHSIFHRKGADLLCQLPVSFTTATLGGEIEVPTLEGKVKLKIPKETQSGNMLRLRGKGVKPVRGGAQGDLLCEVLIETPVKLSQEQQELLYKFDQSLKNDNHPKTNVWFSAVKKFFENIQR